MKQIPLSRNQQAIVDDDDYEFLSQWQWLAMAVYGGRWYAVRFEGKTAIMMHRVILGLPDHLETDHKNGDGLDNRRENLRPCTHTQNMQNRSGWMRKNSKNPSKFKGVYFEPRRSGQERPSPWVAQIVVNKKKIRRYRTTEEEAAKVYDQLAAQFFGQFAVFNFPALVAI